eukprot:SAG11_NODE_1307_length_5243_cov_2.389774_3_plen_44_part_00
MVDDFKEDLAGLAEEPVERQDIRIGGGVPTVLCGRPYRTMFSI